MPASARDGGGTQTGGSGPTWQPLRLWRMSTRMIVDLHCHSTASDGVLAPEVLVERAHARGIELLALTDHDTLEGLVAARAAAASLGSGQFTGSELSWQWNGATIQVLGYPFDAEATALKNAIAKLHAGRWQRAELIGQRLADKGMAGAHEGAREVQQQRADSGN